MTLVTAMSNKSMTISNLNNLQAVHTKEYYQMTILQIHINLCYINGGSVEAVKSPSSDPYDLAQD